MTLQDSYDNAGMQVGEADAEARGALLCIDVTEEVLDEAVANGCNLVISHHPLIFKGVKSVTGKTYVERCIRKAIKSDVAIYAAHTNLDNAFGGVNYKMAEKIGLKNIRALQPAGSLLVKLVTFVPVAHAEKVRRFKQNFQIVRQKLKELEEKDRIRNFQPPVKGEEIMRTFNLPACSTVGDIKMRIKDAILDGVIPNEYEAARQYMLDVAEREFHLTAHS